MELQKALDDMVAAGTESAVQVAVYRDGELVADACAGPADSASLFHAASTAKGIAAAVAHVLVDRGAIAYDTRVADVWPAFGVNGKDSVTLRDVLLHTAGLPGLP